MALITEIEIITRANAQARHGIRPCTAFYEPGHYLQLDTYASEGGRSEGDATQSIRFEREGTVQLLKLIALTFPDLLPNHQF